MTELHKAFKDLENNMFAMANTSAGERRQLLKKLREVILRRRTDINAALYQDYRRNDIETELADTFVVVKEINYAIKNLESWMQPKRVGNPLILFGSSSFIRYESRGVVLIMSPWNFPFNLSLVPLVSAIAAGNVAVIKPSEYTSASSTLIKEIIEEVFSSNQVKVIEGGVEVSKQLLELPFHHIHFTGSPHTGKIIMAAAAKHLASVTLELGGKSPAIVDQGFNLKKAAEMIVWSKYINKGQICITTDYVLAHESIERELIEALKKAAEEFFILGDAEKNPSYSRVATAGQFNKVIRLVNNAVELGAKTETEFVLNEEEKFISPLIISNIPEGAEILKEEIFGPVLPVLTYRNIEEAVQYINRGERPLVLYAFSNKAKNRDYILRQTRAGATVFNQLFLHHYNSELPFGGVNNSGMGKGHGHFGFLEFSNSRAVVRQWLPLNLFKPIYPPYNSLKRKLVSIMLRFLS